MDDLVVGPVAQLAELVRARRVLLVCTTDRAGIGGMFDEVERFRDFSPNPRLADALAGARVAERYAPDLIVGVGGGSAMDVAKLVRALPIEPARDALAGRVPPVRRGPPLLGPTAVGSGGAGAPVAAAFVHGAQDPLRHPSGRG